MKAQAAKAEAGKVAREVEGIDLRKYEERRQHKESRSFKLPDTETAVTISGYTKLSVIHDFDKIESPIRFITSKIVVDGQPSGVPRVNNQSGQTDTSLQRTLFTALNLVWSPIQQIDIGGELLWGQRKNKNGADGHATRIQFSTRCVF